MLMSRVSSSVRSRYATTGPFAVIAIGLAMLLAAGGERDSANTWTSAVARAGEAAPDVRLRYGTPVEVGNGRARAYIVTDRAGETPLEIGIRETMQTFAALSDASRLDTSDIDQ